MIALILFAALTVAPGAPAEVSVPDFDHGCFLGDWEGAETRLVFEGAPEVPFFLGTPGEGLEPAGKVAVPAGPRGRGDVTVRTVQEFVTTKTWEAVTDEGDLMEVAPGTRFTIGDCAEACRVQVGNLNLWALEDSWIADEVPAALSPDEGWWVPVVRAGRPGWVRGDHGFVVEVRCIGPDEGADLTKGEWH